jgi:coproporphyrinogen III oxidase
MITKEQIADYKTIQDEICLALEAIRRCRQSLKKNCGNAMAAAVAVPGLLQNGNVLEKGGVNFSAVHGELPDSIKKP